MMIDGINIVELIGLEGAILLAEKLGGIRINVPKKDRHGRLSNCIGIEAANKMYDAFGSFTISISPCNDMLALHYRQQGLSQEAVALKLRMTHRGVAKLLNRMKAAAI